MTAEFTTSAGFDRLERRHTARARRAYDSLNVKPLTVTGATLAAERAVADYDSAAATTGDPVAEASAPILLLIAKDRLIDAGVALRFELSKVAEHRQSAVHSMQRQERRADRATDLVARLLAALVTGDDEQVIVDAISFLHSPDRQERATHDAALAAVADAAAYQPKSRVAAVTR